MPHISRTRPSDTDIDVARRDAVRRSPVADLLGRVLSPLVVVPAFLTWVSWTTSATPGAAAGWAAATTGLIVGVPFGALLLMRLVGRVSDAQVVSRRERPALLAVAVLATVGAAVLVQVQGAPPGLRHVVLAMTALLAVLAALTRWKPSFHAAVTAAVLLDIAMADVVIGLLGAMTALPLVAWARIRAGRHTPAQVVVGAVLGTAVPAATSILVRG
jgi:membrane-associated phospholipid phosphatase